MRITPLHLTVITLLPMVASLHTTSAAFTPVLTRGGEANTVYVIHPLADGRLLIGGDFQEVNGTARNCIARLNSDGSLDSSFDPGTGVEEEDIPSISVIKELADGGLLIGGYFEGVAGHELEGLARLHPNGGWDSNFVHHLAADTIHAIEVQTDGKLVVGGRDLVSEASHGVARLNADGSTDTNFGASLGASGVGLSLGIDAQGRILVGGQFAEVNGIPRPGLARLNPDGSLDTNFVPVLATSSSALLPEVHQLFVLADGKILIRGSFSSVDGQQRPMLARLDQKGRLDESYQPLSNSPLSQSLVRDALPLPGGALLIGGLFGEQTAAGAWNYSLLARLLPDGSLDSRLAVERWPETYRLSPHAIAARSNSVFVGGRLQSRWDEDLPSLSLDVVRVDPLLLLRISLEFTDDVMEISAPAIEGRSYVLEHSTNLMTWSSVTTNIANSELLRFYTTFEPRPGGRFYRARIVEE